VAIHFQRSSGSKESKFEKGMIVSAFFFPPRKMTLRWRLFLPGFEVHS